MLHFFLTLFVLCLLYTESTNSTDCITPNKENAKCISIYSCDRFLKALPNASNSTIKFMQESQCGDLKVCCGKSTNYQKSANSTDCITPNKENAKCISIYSCDLFLKALSNASNSTITFMQESQCGDLKVCCGKSTNYQSIIANVTNDNVNTKPNANWRPFASRKICGYQHTDDRYYTENVTAIDEFPWMAQLLYDTSDGIRDMCAGSLISRRYVLTAAHCIVTRLYFVVGVRLGEYDKKNDTDCASNPDFPECADPTIDVGIEMIIRHPSYKPGHYNNDIALIRLIKNVAFTEFIRPICLPIAGHPNATDGDFLVTSGWGRTTFRGNTTARIKKRSSNKITTLEECSRQYESHRRVVINSSIICTLDDEINFSCQGDSGGPGMFKIGLQWQQDGIVSFGRDCGIQNIAAGNTRVSYYMDWIISTIKP